MRLNFAVVLLAIVGSHSCRASLYNSDDPIVQLSDENFTATVLNSGTSWVVEFYSSWCGHCQRFVPTYVQYGRSIEEWNKVVRVGAIDCADAQNTRICRYLNVRGYPTIKFFPRYATPGNRGYLYRGNKDSVSLMRSTIDYLRTETAFEDRPDINPVNSPTAAMERRKRLTRSVFLVATRDRYLAAQIIYDLSPLYPETIVTWSDSRNLQHHGVYRYPSLHQVRGNGRLQFMTSANTRERIVSAVQNEIQRRRIISTTPEDMVLSTTVATTTEDLVVSTTVTSTKYNYTPPIGVHSQDLDSNIYFSFWTEIAAQATLSDRRLDALKRYVNVLARYFGGSDHVHRFIRKVDNWLRSVREPLTGEEWTAHLNELQDVAAYVPDVVRWTGCKGSESRYRGYPCSMWTNFHALTVNAYLEEVRGTFNPQEVLEIIRDYMKYFFGCRECARHFESMAVNIRREVVRPYDGILWLWRAHNQANERLKDDPTTDPEQGKAQFPVSSACQNCRTQDRYGRTEWSETHVVYYLLNFYRKENVIADSMAYEFKQQTTTPGLQETVEEEGECSVINTAWSHCSQSCDTGVSWRMSNNNRECQMRMEHRLCFLQPCNAQFSNKFHPSCQHRSATYRLYSAANLIYGSCRSENTYNLRYCGQCAQLCCYPQQSSTQEIDMLCEHNGEQLRGKAQVEFIDRCTCEQCT